MTVLIETHLAHLRGGGYATTTIESRRRLLLNADDWLPYGLDEADADELAAYLGYENWSRWTRHTYHKHLDGYYAWAVRTGHISHNPLEELPRPPAGDLVPDPVTDDELAYALEHSPDQPWRTAVMLAAYAGLRACEIVNIRRRDITRDRVEVRNGKGGRDGFVPTHEALWAYVQHRNDGLLVRSARGNVLDSHALVARQYKHWRRIGLPEIHLHRFRHWYGTALLKAGADLRTVQELMRHKSITSTQGYTQVVDEQRRLAICTLPVPATSTQVSTAA